MNSVQVAIYLYLNWIAIKFQARLFQLNVLLQDNRSKMTHRRHELMKHVTSRRFRRLGSGSYPVNTTEASAPIWTRGMVIVDIS